MNVELQSLPILKRYDAGLSLIEGGDDPELTLAAVVFGEAVAVFDREPTIGRRQICVNGHELDEENTYIRPSGKRDCRKCRATYRRSHKPRDRSKLKVPCHYCGAPACPPGAKNSAGHPLPRCRDCFRKTLRGKR